MTGLHLGGQVQQCGAGHEATAMSLPGKGMHAVLDGEIHEVMPRGMELDLVDTVSVCIVGVEFRRELVGVAAPLKRLH